MTDLARWRSLAQHPSLGVVLDLDGTLIPFAPTPDESRVDPELQALLRSLVAMPSWTVAIVSGRPRGWLEAQLGAIEGLLLVAEHGAHRRAEEGWQSSLDLTSSGVTALADRLESVARRTRGAIVERKTWSVAFHVRSIPEDRKVEMLVQAGAIIQAWLAAHPGFERLDGAEVLEIRPQGMRKSTAVGWIRQRAGADARLLAIGDDLTDEDTFGALSPSDEAIVVAATPMHRPTLAGSRLGSPDEVRAFLRAFRALRLGENAGDIRWPDSAVLPSPRDEASDRGLLVVSNRLPDLRTELTPSGPGLHDARKRNVGGLVAALEPALSRRRGLWLGWSGRTVPDGERLRRGVDSAASPSLAWLDFSERWFEGHYNGMSNRALWPLFHCFPERVRIDAREWQTYVEVNEAFAEAALEHVGPTAPIWIHDYHLLLVGGALRKYGHTGPIGLFLHIPFPPLDILAIFPWANELLEAMTELDLVGFHTPGYADNFMQAARTRLGAVVTDGELVHRGRRTRVRSIPIGIFPESFQEPTPEEVQQEIAQLSNRLEHRKLVLGVDRLDYTKGIPERLLAFQRLLEKYPEWHDRVSFVQVSVPSRADVPAYAEQRERIENLVGRINGEHGEAFWVPVRYLYRSYGRSMLAELYRRAEVGLVTPLRDGMNLVAKEYVAAQSPESPGVLVLSELAGAAVELREAVLTNPWHIEAMADALHEALSMPLEERVRRHTALRATVERTTALTWAEDFLRELTQG